jgi:hypothetical protein
MDPNPEVGRWLVSVTPKARKDDHNQVEIGPGYLRDEARLGKRSNRSLTRFEFGARSGKHQHGLVI